MSPIESSLILGSMIFCAACMIVAVVAWVDARRYAAKARQYHEGATALLMQSAGVMGLPLIDPERADAVRSNRNDDL